MKGSIVYGGAFAVVVAVACSSSSTGGGNGNCNPPSFLGQACLSCLATACQGDAQAACNQNNAFVNCYCPCTSGGGSPSSCTTSCANSSCTGAIAACVQTNIATGGACNAACVGGGGAPDGGGGGASWVSCYAPNPGSTPGCSMGLLPPSGQANYDAQCTAHGEQPGTGCPTAGLAGCCVLSNSATCAYGNQGQEEAQACAALGGTYQTTPP